MLVYYIPVATASGSTTLIFNLNDAPTVIHCTSQSSKLQGFWRNEWRVMHSLSGKVVDYTCVVDLV